MFWFSLKRLSFHVIMNEFKANSRNLHVSLNVGMLVVYSQYSNDKNVDDTNLVVRCNFASVGCRCNIEGVARYLRDNIRVRIYKVPHKLFLRYRIGSLLFVFFLLVNFYI